jgi:hypothetical protein
VMKVQSSIALETRKAQELSLLGFHYFRRARFQPAGRPQAQIRQR